VPPTSRLPLMFSGIAKSPTALNFTLRRRVALSRRMRRRPATGRFSSTLALGSFPRVVAPALASVPACSKMARLGFRRRTATTRAGWAVPRLSPTLRAPRS
jgi:hypothetical protein